MFITIDSLCSELRCLIDKLQSLKITNVSSGTYSANEVHELQLMYRQHCIHEEELMEEVKFPYIYAHILAHSIASKYFIRLLTPVEFNSHYTPAQLVEDIMEHIDTYDTQFWDYLNQKSAKSTS